MTHLLFVTGEYPPLEGGVGAYTAELGQALAQSGMQVSVVTSVRAKTDQALAAQVLAGEQAISVYPIIQRWQPPSLSAIAQLAKEIKADWIHVQYQTAAYAMNPSINLAPRWWSSRLRVEKIRVAWTYHDLLPPYLFPKAGATVRQWVTEQPAHTSQLVIVTNEGDRLQLAQKGVQAAKIPIGSNIKGQLHTAEQRAARRQQRNLASDALVIGYFGFLNRSKGGATVIRTLQRLLQERPNTQLLMIGDVAGASDPTNRTYFAEIEQLISDLGLQNHVHWTGREEDGEVSADLGACDLLLLPYLDGASLRRGTLMAALANGCPIVTTLPQAPLPELVEGRDLLYMPVEDDASAERLILQTVSQPEVVDNLRRNAWERSKLFTWESIAQQHCGYYEGGKWQVAGGR